MIEAGDPEAIEKGTLELEAELENARAAWMTFDSPGWPYLCKFWENKVQRLLDRLRTTDLDGRDLGLVQGELAAFESMLRVKDTFRREAKDVQEGIALLRKAQAVPQNTRVHTGDPEIRQLVEQDRASRQQRFNGA